jgi:hypothetical protein
MPARRVRHNEIEQVIELTFDREPKTRSHALRELCPCHVKSNDGRVWRRVFEMAADPDVRVRKTVVHALADGSPRLLEPQVIATLESMRSDPDDRLAKTIRRLLGHYRRTGKINVL